MKQMWHSSWFLWVWLSVSAIGIVLAKPSAASGSILEDGEPEERRTVGIFQKLAPAMLFLTVSYQSAHPLPSPTTTGVGAGFIVDGSGRVLTNAHVVDGASTIMATLYDGRRVKAELLGLDPLSDVAVLQLPSSDKHFVSATLGDSNHLHVGQRTLVVGSPFAWGLP